MSSMPGKAPKGAVKRLRRRYARYRCEFPVAVSLFRGDAPEQLSAHSKDLSEAGIGVLAAAELALGEVVSLTFTLPGVVATWKVRAVLRHRRGFHYGFEFLSLSGEQSKELKTFLPSLDRADSDESSA
jgi:c-di-GMP-binding flagellar brake protein YcgR